MDNPATAISFVGPGGITNPGIDVIAPVIFSSITPPPTCPSCTERLTTTISIDPLIDNIYVGGWDVIVTNASGRATRMSRAFQVEMAMSAPPTAVTDLAETATDCSAGTTCDITLIWTPPAVAATYDVRYSGLPIDSGTGARSAAFCRRISAAHNYPEQQ